ncbi:5-bromo-4-chloroindolyl phosphate hydrolysis family protein [Domibacillus sp. A3M-37]|uniref:5-bromo-4-chloroindolyl phosphate hydrolysis family protein n=1 Tax=Domibacillus sp. A3M-37 TaxID=2962037 RepID=UPI0020B7C821|nr:5-bromo-4-chloroindolyl phosphate hydrolysis family protein [Domibacillus sp. A3M-37]MCP3762826.1 5-bromo-4-chloroindolyl phosphate hydrolysis family protein [Domibacillus sp. A3M-37]
MRYSLYWFRRLAVSFGTAVLATTLFDGFLAYGAFAASFAVTFMLYTNFGNRRIQKKHGLNRREYYYILDQLKEAKAKLSRLQHLFLKVRSLRSLKQMIELNSLVKRIYSVVKKEPKRFYEIEPFFYSHLDSVVELAEKSSLLSSKKVKDPDMKKSLLETTETLGDLSQTLEADLRQVLARDIEHLTIELDVAKQRAGRTNQLSEPEPAKEGDKKDEQRITAPTGTRYGRKK